MARTEGCDGCLSLLFRGRRALVLQRLSQALSCAMLLGCAAALRAVPGLRKVFARGFGGGFEKPGWGSSMTGPHNKDESIDLFKRLRYGNNVQQWDTVEQALDSDVPGFVIRYRGTPGVQGPAIFGVPRSLLLPTFEATTMHWERKRLYINEEIDRHRILIQGELVLNWQDGWLFRGRRGGGMHMREAMRTAETWRGWRARELLRMLMDPSSWEDLSLCIDEWPDAVIELVVMDTPVGAMAHTGRRGIIWECRNF